MKCVLCAGLPVLVLASCLFAQYQPPEYPQAATGVSEIVLSVSGDLQPGATLKAAFRITSKRKLETPRLFLHVVRGDKALHVAVFEPQHALDPGLNVLSFDTTLPADLPGGAYELVGGVYLEPAVARQKVTVKGDSDAPLPIIINTGTFVDKFGTPHRWHVNKTHTLYWDGVPFLPIGGMHIPDENFDTFKAQIDLLARHNVRDVYWNVGHSTQMPRTWESKSDDRLRHFQRCIDYMDEAGIRYGMQFSGLQANGYAYQLMGGKEVVFTIRPGESEPRLERSNDEQWYKDGKVNVAFRRVRDGFYLIAHAETGKIVASGAVEVARDEREGREGRERSPEEQVVRIPIPAAEGQSHPWPPGEYKLYLTIAAFIEGWNSNMHFWGEDTPKYYQAIRDLYEKMRMGPGFRFVVDAFWNENNFNHGFIPWEESFRTKYAAYLESRYGSIARLREAWHAESNRNLETFEDAANFMPIRTVREAGTDTTWDYLIHRQTKELLRVPQSTSQHRYDLVESVSKQVRDFHIEIADVIKELFDVPVVFKFFSGVDHWHANDAGIAGGHDGVGMETYGLGEPQLAFMGIAALSSCKQSTKTMWLIVTEVGEGNHQDQALSRNKLFGCTSRLGSMYPMYASLIGGGAKGIYHYYMVPSPGADRFWEDATIRDPRQLEWMGTFARIVDSAADRLADYEPTAYYRFPALMHPNSGLLFSDPNRDYFNTDCLWWVDPAGKLPNGAWMLPTFSLSVPTDMMLINLENTPATLRWADEVNAYLDGNPRVTWLGYRKDIGRLPAIDRYYTAEFAEDDDGVEIQVLKPSSDCRVIAANADGKVWNLMAGNLQIISKDARNKTGWRPDRVVLDGKDHRFDYRTFMRETLGVQEVDCDVEAFTFIEGDERVTVFALPPETEKTVQIGEQFPPWRVDAVGNPLPGRTLGPVTVAVRGIPSGTTATYAGGQAIEIPRGSEFSLTLWPDELVLSKSNGKPAWAREGLVFDSTNSRAAAIFRSPAGAKPLEPVRSPAPQASPAITVEAEDFVESNFNLNTFSGLAGLSGYGMLGLATQVPPPGLDGYFATYEFQVAKAGTYVLRVRQSYLATASPGRWRIDDGPWQEALNEYVPEDIRIVTQYNSLDDERMIFAWYTYGTYTLSAGTHRLAYSVVSRRPGGLDIGLQNSTPYSKLLDCFEFVPVATRPEASPHVRVNLLANPSLEEDTGGWTASEWTDGRWKWFELRDDHGWDRDFWWTRKVGGEGRVFIDGFMDLGGMTIRQSYVGVRSLRVRAGEQPRRFSAQPVAVTPGEKIGFGGWVRAETVHATADLRLRFLDVDGREVAVTATPAMRGDTHWQEAQLSVVVPQGARSAVLDCQMEGGKKDLRRFGRNWHDTAWFDDLYIFRVQE
jgi:hypothetical protein